ncbi:hypothetical protein EYF80_025708 [Liparis tanakae]|uniref:Uncharacterized protein n=1 Tax=Liparis tanakae TaxID=230148 RepID=A0A4Z2HEV6_9TELE|nr:hypothetical protein EYF80_025708 [Liparis tanakae]
MYQEADEMSSSAVVNVSAGVTRGSGTFTLGPRTLKGLQPRGEGWITDTHGQLAVRSTFDGIIIIDSITTMSPALADDFVEPVGVPYPPTAFPSSQQPTPTHKASSLRSDGP